MSLVGQTVWVVGGVGAVGRGIARSLLQAGATVICNSRSAQRIEHIREDLEDPDRLITVQGRLLTPDQAAETIEQALVPNNLELNHVVAHGAVRYWTTVRAGCDETYSLANAYGSSKSSFLEQSPADFVANSSLLASLHFSAAQALLPRLVAPLPAGSNEASAPLSPSYTFVTGDGGGHPSTRRSAMGEINSHHVWGLAAALRQELSRAAAAATDKSSVLCREIRVDLPVNPVSIAEQTPSSSSSSFLSDDIGTLCAGLIATSKKRADENGRLLNVSSQQALDDLLNEYQADDDKSIDPLPHFTEFVGSL